MMMSNPYRQSCSTKAKRVSLVKQVQAVASQHGATVLSCGGLNETHRESIVLSLGPYQVRIAFDGKSNVGAFLGHWHTCSSTNARYPENFWVNCGGSVNTCHFQKATTFADTFEQFLGYLDDGLGRLAFILATAHLEEV